MFFITELIVKQNIIKKDFLTKKKDKTKNKI